MKRFPGSRIYDLYPFQNALMFLVGSQECFPQPGKASQNAETCLVQDPFCSLWHFL